METNEIETLFHKPKLGTKMCKRLEWVGRLVFEENPAARRSSKRLCIRWEDMWKL